jgi:hypothetical protein
MMMMVTVRFVRLELLRLRSVLGLRCSGLLGRLNIGLQLSKRALRLRQIA